jgi:hypothetical protein
MLDSGAYSAFAGGHPMPDLDEYAAWAIAQAQHTMFPLRVTSLDVIPGGRDLKPTRREQQKAMKQSRINARQLRAKGLRVIDVYHIFEPLKVLDEIVENRLPGETIGLGGLGTFVGMQTRIQWADAVFKRLKDLCGWDALPPVHAFGVANTPLVFRYPLASADASSWNAPARWGYKVDKRGKIDPSSRNPESNPYSRHSEVQKHHTHKMLNAWAEREHALKRVWQERGVTILDEAHSPLLERSP